MDDEFAVESLVCGPAVSARRGGLLPRAAASAALECADTPVPCTAEPSDIAELVRLDPVQWLRQSQLRGTPGAQAALCSLNKLHALGVVSLRWQRNAASGIEPLNRLHPLVRMALERRRAAFVTGSQAAGEPRISLRVMGGFEIRVDGQPLSFGRKPPTRLLAFLKCLLARGGRGVSMQSIVDALWPEAEGDATVRNFEVGLHRLRQRLGVEGALRLRDNRLTLDESLCQVDVWTLEESFEYISANRCGAVFRDAAAILGAAEAMLAAYRGPFLAEEMDYPDYFAARDRLRGSFLCRVVWIADALERLGCPQQAAEVCRRGIDVEPAAAPLQRWLANRQFRATAPGAEIGFRDSSRGLRVTP